MSCCCGSPLVLATTLLLLVGSLTEAFVTTTGPQSLSSLSSSSSSSGSPIITTDNGSPMMTSEDDSSDEDDFSSMMGMPPSGVGGPPGQTVYVIEFETEADKASGSNHRNLKNMSDDGSDGQSPLDPWSIVWYIGSFGGLIAFFLIVSCSEWCCRRGARPLNIPYTQRGEVINANGTGTNAGLVTESPPPPYHLFAPPPYDSVNYAEIAGDCSKQPASGTSEKLDIYVISLPIQAAPAQPPPA